MKNQQKYKQLRKASNESNVENKQKRRGKKQDLGEYTVHITENKFKKRREKTSNHKNPPRLLVGLLVRHGIFKLDPGLKPHMQDFKRR